MIKPTRRVLVLALALALATMASGAIALASKPVKGATYIGATAHGKAPIELKVSANGKSVTVKMLSPPLYCQGGGGPELQITKVAAIAKSGSFKGSNAYESRFNHKITALLLFSGKFSGRTVTGSARSEFLLAKTCDGSTSFSARATRGK
jgi:hypothetical protein